MDSAISFVEIAQCCPTFCNSSSEGVKVLVSFHFGFRLRFFLSSPVAKNTCFEHERPLPCCLGNISMSIQLGYLPLGSDLICFAVSIVRILFLWGGNCLYESRALFPLTLHHWAGLRLHRTRSPGIL